MNLRKAKTIVDDVILVLRDLDSANTRILAGALEGASGLLETEIMMSTTKAPDFRKDPHNYFQGWSVEDIADGRAPLNVIRQYNQHYGWEKAPMKAPMKDEEGYVDKDFLDELKGGF